MADKPPYLTIVDNDHSSQSHDDEFIPLPDYPWDERPSTLPLDSDEAATAIHLANGDEVQAAQLLRVPIIRLRRLIRASPRLQRIYEEALGVTLAKAASIPIQTLWDPNADNRRREWASTTLLKSRLARDHLLAPAPPANLTSSLPGATTGTLILKWGEPPADDDELPIIDNPGAA